MTSHKYRVGNEILKLAIFVLPLFFLLTGARPLISQAQESISGPQTTASPENQLGQSIDKTLRFEKENLQELKDQLDTLAKLKETVTRELDAYKLQMSMHGNLLMHPTSGVGELEKARDDHKSTLNAIIVRLGELREKRDAIVGLQRQADEKYTLYEKQLAEIKAERSKGPEDRSRIQQFESLVQLVSSQRATITQIVEIYARRISQLEQTQQALTTLTGRFDQEIPIRKKQDLFRRNVSPFTSLGHVAIKEDVRRILEQATLLTTAEFWQGQTRAVWPSGWFSFYMFLFLLLLVYILFVRLRHYFIVWMRRPEFGGHPWTMHTLKLLHRSFPLLGVTAFLYGYAHVRLVYSSALLLQMVVHGLLVLLFFRWALDLLRVRLEGDNWSFPDRLRFRLRLFVNGVRVFTMAYLVVFWMVGESTILFLSRVVFEVVFFVWGISFLKAFRIEMAASLAVPSRLSRYMIPLVVGVGYLISGGGILLEFAGFGKLALHWYVSWGRSLAVSIWAGLLFASLWEWKVTLSSVPKVSVTGPVEKVSPVKWLLLRLSWLLWASVLVLALVFAWGGSQTIVVGLVNLLTHPIQVGNMDLRLVGFIYATVILFCTHAAARLLRRVLRDRVLSGSGIEIGLQASVTTIIIYLFWGLGILLSLNVMGLSATSIAVAFGALSIGLGFGLQNIFNNFVSGLILLIERPIQVGDVVQVNDEWGVVTKINVRSTVVQTYDNASLIIPNADMISNQVTNWSFKDQRLRRNIYVGVAYGSDIELVRETLLEIAKGHPKVLKKPKPDVLFQDFGDSALIFRLRLWSTIDHFISVETDVRFTIDQLFRERGIEIAFPQRDIHIRSTVESGQLQEQMDS